ncbi:hypothetical protein ACFX2J_028783 [Malus domestica]
MECHNDFGAYPYCVLGVTLPDDVYPPLSQHLSNLQRVLGPGSGIWPKSKSFKTNVLVLLPKGGKVIPFVQLHLLGKGKSQI